MSMDVVARGLAARIGKTTQRISLDRNELASLSERQRAYLAEGGREGSFTWRNGDMSAKVQADPNRGIYVPPGETPSGALGAWERTPGPVAMIEWFGCRGDGVTDNSALLQQALDTMHALYPEGFTLTAEKGRKFRLVKAIALTPKCTISGIHLVNAGDANFFNVNQNVSAAEAFSSFYEHIRIENCAFEGDVSNVGIALFAANIRFLWFVGNRLVNTGGVSITHGADIRGLYKSANGVAGDEGVGVDPAVTAGFSSGPDFGDLSSNIVIANNYGDSGRYNASLVRLEFVKDVAITGNVFRGGKVSWWGGGAPSAEGGEVWMARRVRNVQITGNYLCRTNGAIYGNNGDGMTITGNVVEDVLDTALDLEGCFNCTVTGNVVRNAGNFCTSIFYASLNNVFANNVLIQTKRAKNIAAIFNQTGYMSSVTVASSAGTDGRVRLVKAASHGFGSDQLVNIRTKSGAVGTALTQAYYGIVVIDEVTVELVGTEGIGSLEGTVSSIRYQRGNTFFDTKLAGFDTLDDADRVLWTGNTCIYEGDHDLGWIKGDTAMRSMVVSNNVLRNVGILDASIGNKSIIQGNLLEFDSAPLATSAAKRLIQSTGRIIDNTLKTLPGCSLPAGSVGIASYCYANSGAWSELRGNRVEDLASAITYHLGYEYQNGSNYSNVMVADNVFDTITDLTPSKGRVRVFYSGNRSTGITQSLPIPATSSIGSLGGICRGTRLESGATMALGGVIARVALDHGWDTNLAWAGTTAYVIGDIRYVGTSVYRCTIAGTSATGSGPSGMGTAITDGTATWTYIAPLVTWAPIATCSPDVASSAASGTITPDLSAASSFIRTALTAALTINAPTGSAFDGQVIRFRLKDNGTTRTVAWNAIYRAIGAALPIATTAGKTTYATAIYNAADLKWDVTAVQTEA